MNRWKDESVERRALLEVALDKNAKLGMRFIKQREEIYE